MRWAKKWLLIIVFPRRMETGMLVFLMIVLIMPFKNSFLRFYSPAHCPVQCAKGTVLILTYISVMVMTL